MQLPHNLMFTKTTTTSLDGGTLTKSTTGNTKFVNGHNHNGDV